MCTFCTWFHKMVFLKTNWPMNGAFLSRISWFHDKNWTCLWHHDHTEDISPNVQNTDLFMYDIANKGTIWCFEWYIIHLGLLALTIAYQMSILRNALCNLHIMKFVVFKTIWEINFIEEIIIKTNFFSKTILALTRIWFHGNVLFKTLIKWNFLCFRMRTRTMKIGNSQGIVVIFNKNLKCVSYLILLPSVLVYFLLFLKRSN